MSNGLDYNAVLHEQYTRLNEQTRAGTLPLDERIQAVDSAVSAYVAAQDDDFERKYVKGGHVPIQLRNSALLDRMADLLMHEYLTWDHHDKMNIVDNPILSKHQQKYRHKRENTLSDVYTGKNDETIGRHTDEDGVKRRVYDYMTPKKDNALIPTEHLDLYSAIEKACLTERQRQVISSMYSDGMTQEMAANSLGISRRTLRTTVNDTIIKIKRNIPRHSS